MIGPDSGAIDRLGDKRHAKAVAEEAGVSVTPWVKCAGEVDAETLKAVNEIGFPVMIKPAAGGGGKGMHRADDEAQLTKLLPQAAREAKAGFGDDALLVEKFLATPRHSTGAGRQARCCISGSANAACNAGTRNCLRKRPARA